MSLRLLANSPILITGSHRSGTTWVGKVLSQPRRLHYVHEPFNVNAAGFAELEHWYTYVCADNEHRWAAAFETHMGMAFNPWLRTRLASRVSLTRQGQSARAFVYNRLPGCHVILKDPLAFFSSEWLSQRYGFQVVVLVRHPAAFAGSLKQRSWDFPFAHLRDQPLLMRDFLSEYRTQIEDFADRRHDIIDQAALLWNLIYGTAAKLLERHPNWNVVRHEDLSREPVAEFRTLASRLGVPFTRASQHFLERTSAASNTVETAKPHQLARDSRSNVWSWTQRLSPEEIARVRGQTEATARHWYGPIDWQPPM
ncbi:sulfotransferase [Persicimonas caeni]|uniref:Sulfotransferase n=1 Tax=Persicimonas caeni TaxID=2292766 RepID=A0A4Y6PTQ5_PERCE|nr:sulfotransferase [Persicimonas caeni]QDG51702.1 sulfotransferase [Persicimonas caeni]QED32923.1 sulfotransferase [Persicimonas caeni]